MRQILTSKHKALKDISGTQIELEAEDFKIESVEKRPRLVRAPLQLKLISNIPNVNFTFSIAPQLAKKGVMLLGAYYDNGEVSAVVCALNEAVDLGPKETLVIGTLMESVRYRVLPEIDINADGTVKFAKKEPKGRRKK